MFGVTCSVQSKHGASANRFREAPVASDFSLRSTSASSSPWLSLSRTDDMLSEDSDSDDEIDVIIDEATTYDQFPFRSFHEPRIKPLRDNTFVTEFSKQPKLMKRASSFSHFVHSMEGMEDSPAEIPLLFSGDSEVPTARALLLLESGNVTAAEHEVLTNYMHRAFELAGV